MSVSIKSAREIELMRTAGKLLEEVHNELADFVKPGISTLDIDRYGELCGNMYDVIGCAAGEAGPPSGHAADNILIRHLHIHRIVNALALFLQSSRESLGGGRRYTGDGCCV